MVTYLRNHYGIRHADRVTELLEQLMDIKQRIGESTREYLTRTTALLYKLGGENNDLNFLTIGDGQIASYLIRKGLRNEQHKSLLYYDGNLEWKHFERKIIHIAQADRFHQ